MESSLLGGNEILANHELSECGSAGSMDASSRSVNVYIWDMDETLILLKSLLDGTYAQAFNGLKDVQRGIEIGRHWENSILKVCDDLFFYEEIEDYNEPFLKALDNYDDGRDLSDYDFSKDNLGFPFDDSRKRKLAYRHRVIAEKYSKGLLSVLDEGKIKLWNNLYDVTDTYTDGWLSSGRDFLKQISSGIEVFDPEAAPSKNSAHTTDRNCENINVLVTSGSLIPSLVKCLLFRLDDVIPHGNIYSSWEVGKHQCFSWIKERFDGPSVRFCVIGDGIEECTAAEKMRWPFVHIDISPKGTHRFPGLTTRTLGFYVDVIYKGINHENDKKNNEL